MFKPILDKKGVPIFDEFIPSTDYDKISTRISRNGTYKMLNKYHYFETLNDVYYDVNKKIFFDNDKNVIFISNHCLKDNTSYLLSHIDKIDVSISNEMNIEIISIQIWPGEVYGHFLDELTNISHFSELFSKEYDKELTVLVNFKEDNIYHNQNYKTLSNILLPKYINASKYINQILKFKKLYIVKNTYYCETFHDFPILSTNKIVSAFKMNLADLSYAPFNKKIFISRDGTGWKNDRILKKKEEIEQLLQKNGYDIIHPEKIPLDVFVNYLQNASRVFITWGSALTNMIFLKPGTKVIILKSKSYSNENIKMFQKIINNYHIELVEIVDEAQITEENDFMDKIQSFFSQK